MKICNKCKIAQDENCFYIKKAICKNCLKLYLKMYCFKNKEKLREYYKQEKVKEKCRKYKQNNKLKIKQYNKEYKTANKEKIKQQKKYYEYNKRKTDVYYNLIIKLRTRINQAIRSNFKAGSAIKDLGCSIDHLKLHLELFWDEGMSWNNYGQGGWVIDHIIPLSSFDLTDREQFLKAVHYTNLQPLWEKDNLSKGDNLDWKQPNVN